MAVALFALMSTEANVRPTAPARSRVRRERPIAAPETSAQSFVIASGTASTGDRDTATQVTPDGGHTLYEAFVVDPPAAATEPLERTRYIAPMADPVALPIRGRWTFRRAFTLPDENELASLVVLVASPNPLRVRLNGDVVGEHDPAAAALGEEGPRLATVLSGTCRGGTNVLEIDLCNGAGDCTSPCSPAALNYKATVSYSPGR